MKKRPLSTLLAVCIALAMFITPANAASTFPDVDTNAEYAATVEYVNEMEIMVGDENGNFNPNKAVTRAEMATIICRMLGETENLSTDGTVFSDVPVKHWANGYISQAASLNIISGYGDGTFGPEDIVTYEQAITMMVRALGYENEANSAGGYPDGYLSIAQNIGLLEKIGATKGMPLDRKSVAVIVYNSYHSYV